MSPEEGDPAYLWDMLDAARQVVQFTRAVTFEVYIGDPMRRMAVEGPLKSWVKQPAECRRAFARPILRSRGEISSASAMCSRTIMARSSRTGFGNRRPDMRPN